MTAAGCWPNPPTHPGFAGSDPTASTPSGWPLWARAEGACAPARQIRRLHRAPSTTSPSSTNGPAATSSAPTTTASLAKTQLRPLRASPAGGDLRAREVTDRIAPLFIDLDDFVINDTTVIRP